MEYHGFKLDLTALAAALTAGAALWTAVRGQIRKEKKRAEENDDAQPPVP